MIAEGKVSPELVDYNILPWKYSAGTPNILGAIISAQALRLILDLSLNPDRHIYFQSAIQINSHTVKLAMDRITNHLKILTQKALDILSKIDGITIYGPKNIERITGTYSIQR